MAISFYEKGQLSSGFYGWRVVAIIRGRRYQKYFSLHRPTPNIPSHVWFKYQETRARYFEAKWMARSSATQYLDFINKDHPNTKPNRGVGFQGITIGIGTSPDEVNPLCFFSVNKKGKARRFYIDSNTGFSESWINAVKYWGKIYEIRPDDIEKKIKKIPSPEIFKELRKQMNKCEGHDLPPSVLHYVFSDKRMEIKNSREKHLGKYFKVDDEILSIKRSLEQEIESFKNSSKQKPLRSIK